jgi:hypothetical protein
MMMLELADSSKIMLVRKPKDQTGKQKLVHHAQQRIVYDPNTKTVHLFNDDIFPLEAKGARKKRVAQRRENRQEKQYEKQQGKIAVVRAKANKRVAVQEAKQDKRVAVQGAKRDYKVNKFNSKSSKLDPHSDINTAPDGSTPVPPSGGGGGGGNFEPSNNDDQGYYTEQVIIPEDSNDQEYYDQEQMPEDDYSDEEQPMNDPYGLSAGGFWGTAFTAVKGAAKGAIQQVKAQAQNKASTAIGPSQETIDLRNQVAELEKSALIKSAISGTVGIAAGFVLGKFLK